MNNTTRAPHDSPVERGKGFNKKEKKEKKGVKKCVQRGIEQPPLVGLIGRASGAEEVDLSNLRSASTGKKKKKQKKKKKKKKKNKKKKKKNKI